MDSHDHNDLIEREESAAVEFEQKYLRWPVQHRTLIHSHTFLILIGFLCTLGGIGLLIQAAVWPFSIMNVFALAGFALEICLCTWLMIPCKCGAKLTHAARQKFQLQKTRPRRAIQPKTMLLLAGLSLYAVLGSVGSMALLGRIGLIAFDGASLLAFGSLALVLVITNRYPAANDVISAREQREIASIKGETVEDLHKLANYHLRAGNFAIAESYSRKLLAISEEPNVHE